MSLAKIAIILTFLVGSVVFLAGQYIDAAQASNAAIVNSITR